MSTYWWLYYLVTAVKMAFLNSNDLVNLEMNAPWRISWVNIPHFPLAGSKWSFLGALDVNFRRWWVWEVSDTHMSSREAARMGDILANEADLLGMIKEVRKMHFENIFRASYFLDWAPVCNLIKSLPSLLNTALYYGDFSKFTLLFVVFSSL